MLKRIMFSGVGLILLVTPLLASADTTSDLIASLQAQVQVLLAQIAKLKVQSGGQSFCHNFNTDLTVGSSGDEVSALNQALSSSGIDITGNTSSFDENNAGDVVSFQAKYGIRQTGYVGPLTRAKLNSLYKCQKNQQPTTTPPTISATLNSSTFSTSRPTITGTASGLSGVRLSINIGNRVQYSSPWIAVASNGTWSHQVTEVIPPGAYRAVLTTADPKWSEGAVVAEGQVVISGSGLPTPVISFSASPMSGSAPLKVLFTYMLNEEQTCEGRSYIINFGDVSDKDSQRLQKPSGTCQAYIQHTEHVYASAGIYTAGLVRVDVPNTPNKTIGTAMITVSGSGLPTPVISFSASPTSVSAGQSSLLSWSSTNANRCHLTYDSVDKDISVNGTMTVTPWRTTTYNVWCVNDPGTGKDGPDSSKSVTLSVSAVPTPATPTISLQASPTTVSWSTSNANRCVLQYGSSEENVAVNGSKTISPSQTTSYRLWCVNDPGTGKDGPSAEKTVTVYVTTPAPTLTSFTANPTTITEGEPVTIYWNTTNTVSCTASSPTGSWSGGTYTNGPLTIPVVMRNGDENVYTLTCFSSNGASVTKTIKVTVNAAGNLLCGLYRGGTTSANMVASPNPASSVADTNSACSSYCDASGPVGGDMCRKGNSTIKTY